MKFWSVDKDKFDSAWDNFFNTLHTVAEKCSGTLALGVIQCLVMGSSVINKNHIHGLDLFGLVCLALFSTLGLFACCIIIFRVIINQNTCGNVSKFIIFCLFIPAPVGMLLTAAATFKSL